MATFGLRGKSLLALLLACLLALVPAALIGWLALQSIHAHFGDGYARNATLLNREKIRAPISRELALSLRLADSEVTRQWLLDEADEAKRELFFIEAEGYRKDFRDHAYFIGSVSSQGYYFNSDDEPLNQQPRYILDANKAADSWFFSTLRDTELYNINVDFNPTLNTTKVWFNILVNDHDGTTIGLAGSGLDLSDFVRDFIASDVPGVSPMIFDQNGAIQAHQNADLIALNSGADANAQEQFSLFGMLADEAQRNEVRSAMLRALAEPDSVVTLRVTLDGEPQLLALSYLPELGWFVANGVDLDSAQVIDSQWLLPILFALGGLILVLMLLFALAIERLLLNPLRQLKRSAQAMAAGRYDVQMPAARDDEIGELNTAFGIMANKVRHHTLELEQRVQERTSELEQANQEMANAQKKIGDSIDYASLIQRSILPDRELVSALGEHHAVLWRPRDVVGGDFYVFRNEGQHCLLGVVDCAGHGVPGALMTMLAHAALDQAISDCGMLDPAGVLQRTDQIIRKMLSDAPEYKALATNMDVGLAYVNLDQREVIFAGAKIALYYSDGERVDLIPGAKRALGDKRQTQYVNQSVALKSGRTFYLSTDGFLDQAGGENGFGFGNSRFADMLVQHARLPLEQQSDAFSDTLAVYQGDYAQRDDITLLCFRFD
ncbi:biofilm regulation protein phosphatase SiaA [Halopseudomonas pelagia]|uniref:biofilm regulation protein phosphatase SiaA n=1 Tax=Halopseudomonas pelagia TaxID=553151 RepID=UPI00039BEA51|nr:biofilm regulation protein phosphatase SiaA [Halopseudomonas pelagia]|tara:strand:+ start:51214 stop:53208 length:1995 start_codon:yes stop_codon:yes gene_type:complete